MKIRRIPFDNVLFRNVHIPEAYLSGRIPCTLRMFKKKSSICNDLLGMNLLLYDLTHGIFTFMSMLKHMDEMLCCKKFLA